MTPGRETERQDSGVSESVDVQLAGLLRGRELTGPARVTLVPPNIELATGRRLIILRLGSLEGCEHHGSRLLLHLSWGDVVELEGEGGLSGFAHALAGHALALPELTTSLRSYGSPRAGAGEDQEAFFAPLRAALWRSAATRDGAVAAEAFEPDRLASELRAQIAALAAARFPAHAAERRALEAELSDCVAAVTRRLGALQAMHQALREAPAHRKFAEWRRWSEALTEVFSAHDACWPLVRAALRAAPVLTEPPRRRRWEAWIPFRSQRGEGQS